MIFEQRDIEVPSDWSQTATNIVASKYFHGKPGSPERETSVAQLVHRVVDTIADWGSKGRYFKTPQDADNFRNELAHLMLTQKACFNSPVWFNVGVKEARGRLVLGRAERCDQKAGNRGDTAAVFGLLYRFGEDSLGSILDLAKTEGMLFKWGSGTGTICREFARRWRRYPSGGPASGPVAS